MNVIVRMTRRFRDEVAADLHRNHTFAGERLGFVLARWDRVGDDLLVLPYSYLPVADDHYVDDPTVGARIDGRAIRMAMQASFTQQAACLHVHAHHPVMPDFGTLDLAEQRALMPSLVAVAPTAPHGALLLCGDRVQARIWVPGGPSQASVTRISVVGRPCTIQLEAA